MTPKRTKEFLIHSFKHGIDVMLKGAPGVGKTEVFKQAVAAAGHDLQLWHPTVAEPTDYKGLPSISPDGEHATFLPYGELWKAIKAERPTQVLIDDAGHADEGVQKALMQLKLERRINGHILPDCVHLHAATNDIKQQAGVRGLIEPFKSRFHVILEMTVSVSDWKDWAQDAGLDPVVIAFHESAHSVLPDGRPLLFAWEPTKEIRAQPCPRTWEFFARLYASGERDPEVWQGSIGKEAATAFATFEQIAVNCPTNAEILADPHGARIPDEPALRYLTAINLGREIGRRNFESAYAYLNRGEQPYRFLAIQHTLRREAKLAGEGKLRTPDRLISHPLWLRLVSTGGELNALANATI